jgi:hypothetical protein
MRRLSLAEVLRILVSDFSPIQVRTIPRPVRPSSGLLHLSKLGKKRYFAGLVGRLRLDFHRLHISTICFGDSAAKS